MRTTRQIIMGNSKFNVLDTLPTFYGLKTWFELLRVKFYMNDLRENKNYFELVGGSNSQGFKLIPRVKLQ